MSYNILKISKYFGVWRVYNMKKILFAASEAVPFIKTGGLAVARAKPAAVALRGVDAGLKDRKTRHEAQ